MRPIVPFTLFPVQAASAARDLKSLPAGSEVHFNADGPTHIVLPVREHPLMGPAGLRDLQREVARLFSETSPPWSVASERTRETGGRAAGTLDHCPSPGRPSGAPEKAFVGYEDRMREFRGVIEREKARRDEPSADALLILAEAQRALADLEGSAATFLRLLGRGDLDTRQRARFLSGLAVTLREMGVFELALERIDAALALKFTNPHYHCEKGVTLRTMGRRREAEKAIRWAIELNPTLPRFYCELALVYADEARSRSSNAPRESRRFYRMALHVLDGAFGAGPDHPRHFCEQGIILRELGGLPSALTAHRRSIALDPTHPRHHEEMAITLDAMGRADDAAQARAEATRLRAVFF